MPVGSGKWLNHALATENAAMTGTEMVLWASGQPREREIVNPISAAKQHPAGVAEDLDEGCDTQDGTTLEGKTSVCSGDALAEGGPVQIFSIEHSGYLLQYFAVGIIYGGLPATIYGLFLGYLNVPAYVYATASIITTLPWSFKLFLGVLNDSFPVLGYRRKPWMVLGWIICAMMLVVLYFTELPPPYWCVDENGDYIKKVPVPGLPVSYVHSGIRSLGYGG
jgi:hypothetical protein